MELLLAFTGAVAVALAALWFAARGAVTILVAEITNGELRVTKGGISERVLADLRDVVRRPRVKRATLRITRAKDRAEVHVRGDLSAAQVQRLRNVVGTVALAKLVHSRRKK